MSWSWPRAAKVCQVPNDVQIPLCGRCGNTAKWAHVSLSRLDHFLSCTKPLAGDWVIKNAKLHWMGQRCHGWKKRSFFRHFVTADVHLRGVARFFLPTSRHPYPPKLFTLYGSSPPQSRRVTLGTSDGVSTQVNLIPMSSTPPVKILTLQVCQGQSFSAPLASNLQQNARHEVSDLQDPSPSRCKCANSHTHLAYRLADTSRIEEMLHLTNELSKPPPVLLLLQTAQVPALQHAHQPPYVIVSSQQDAVRRFVEGTQRDFSAEEESAVRAKLVKPEEEEIRPGEVIAKGVEHDIRMRTSRLPVEEMTVCTCARARCASDPQLHGVGWAPVSDRVSGGLQPRVTDALAGHLVCVSQEGLRLLPEPCQTIRIHVYARIHTALVCRPPLVPVFR